MFKIKANLRKKNDKEIEKKCKEIFGQSLKTQPGMKSYQREKRKKKTQKIFEWKFIR